MSAEMNQMQKDGFSTLITFANMPTVKIYEKEVQPPGFEAGGAIDTTTMRNTAWRTQAPKSLKSLTPVSMTVAYATGALNTIMTQVGVNQLITLTFPDSSTLAFYGWLDAFTPGSNVEGEQPTATMSIIPSLTDANDAETAPDYEGPAGSE